jgi:hypothetical protein
MKPETVKKSDHISDSIWADNQRWIALASSESEKNRQTRDPLLYRQSSQQQLIKPPDHK